MAPPLTSIQSVENFHLLLLAQFGAQMDKHLYALKGGSNLRFFYRSIRYSEDLDLDVQTIARETLRKKVRQILSSAGFGRILKSSGFEIAGFSEPKQTETTQRWKVQLRAAGSPFDLPTRIEFSRRGMKEEVLFEAIDPAVLNPYQLRPILTSHYGLEAAFAQKLEALIGRRETQTRDLFDLQLLVERGATGKAIKLRQKLKAASENVRTLSFADFQGQVVAYLEPEYQSHYGTAAAWKRLQEQVLEVIQRL
jgi:predicted nucleotidyltransferase component of viral defense system